MSEFQCAACGNRYTGRRWKWNRDYIRSEWKPCFLCTACFCARNPVNIPLQWEPSSFVRNKWYISGTNRYIEKRYFDGRWQCVGLGCFSTFGTILGAASMILEGPDGED